MMEVQPPEWEGVNNPKHRHMRVRCNGHKKNGERCQKPAMKGATVCRTHGGATRHVQRKARQRLEEAADRMARELLRMATDDDVSDATKLAAIRDALDRAGLKPATTVDVEVGPKPYERLIAGIEPMTRAESRTRRGVVDPPAAQPPLQLPQRASTGDRAPGEVVDAEVVTDPPKDRPVWAEGAPADAGRGNGPATPGKGLMSLSQANAEIARRNREANAHRARYTE